MRWFEAESSFSHQVFQFWDSHFREIVFPWKQKLNLSQNWKTYYVIIYRTYSESSRSSWSSSSISWIVDDAARVERVDRVDRGATNRVDDFEFEGVDLVDGVLDVRPRGFEISISSSLKYQFRFQKNLWFRSFLRWTLYPEPSCSYEIPVRTPWWFPRLNIFIWTWLIFLKSTFGTFWSFCNDSSFWCRKWDISWHYDRRSCQLHKTLSRFNFVNCQLVT